METQGEGTSSESFKFMVEGYVKDKVPAQGERYHDNDILQ